jgi:hypothetical protein
MCGLTVGMGGMVLRVPWWPERCGDRSSSSVCFPSGCWTCLATFVPGSHAPARASGAHAPRTIPHPSGRSPAEHLQGMIYE